MGADRITAKDLSPPKILDQSFVCAVALRHEMGGKDIVELLQRIASVNVKFWLRVSFSVR